MGQWHDNKSSLLINKHYMDRNKAALHGKIEARHMHDNKLYLVPFISGWGTRNCPFTGY